MTVTKHRSFDGYAYPLGTYDIDSTAVDKVVDGRYCKLNASEKIVLAGKGEKGYLVVFPNRLPKKGFAICKGAFLLGPYSCNIDENTYDNTQTYTPGDILYVGDEGKLTNQGDAGAVAIATVAKINMISEEGKKCMEIYSINNCVCKPATASSSDDGQ